MISVSPGAAVTRVYSFPAIFFRSVKPPFETFTSDTPNGSTAVTFSSVGLQRVNPPLVMLFIMQKNQLN